MNIFNRNNVDMLFELNEISSFSEMNRISRFIYSFTRLYKKYLVKRDKKNDIYFNTDKPISKKINNTLNDLLNDNDDDIILGLDDILDNNTVTQNDVKDAINEDDIIGIDDLLSYISSSDDSDISFSMNSFGGSSPGSSPRSEYDISNIILKDYLIIDPKLFTFDPLITSPSGNKYTYTRICDGTSNRQPIVVDDDELEKINNSTDIGSGPNSYTNVITTGVDKNLHYICPKY